MALTKLSRNLPPDSVNSLLIELPAARVLDVRTPGEFESAHIRGAYNVPVDTIAEHAREIGSATEAPIVLVCQSGNRARKAEDTLRSVGMSNLHILDGGMNAWVAAGLDIVRVRKRISLERQVRVVAGALAATGGVLALLVNPLYAAIPAAVGSGLVFAGVTDTCAMGMLLTRLPYNRGASCDPAAVVRALTANGEPGGLPTPPAPGLAAAGCCADSV
ncbi:MAG: rhodanese-like domain-containing protein [Gemmatimonadaceae bacterium]